MKDKIINIDKIKKPRWEDPLRDLLNLFLLIILIWFVWRSSR